MQSPNWTMKSISDWFKASAMPSPVVDPQQKIDLGVKVAALPGTTQPKTWLETAAQVFRGLF